MPVHLYGRPAAMREILDIAGSIPVIEDAAQAHGARYAGRRAGSLAAAGCFSFYPTKNLGAFGDAGLITTDDDALAAQVKLLRDHGRVSQYEHAIVGQTARLDNLQAAVLRVQADCLDEWNAHRRQVAAWYRELLPSAHGARKQEVRHVRTRDEEHEADGRSEEPQRGTGRSPQLLEERGHAYALALVGRGHLREGGLDTPAERTLVIGKFDDGHFGAIIAAADRRLADWHLIA